jgi:TetR/AcrR family transcriptional repressor of nem operon
MPRVSRKEADQHKKDVVKAAARLFREHGFDGVSVPELMAEAGLTHGAFYGHFASKEALAAAAVAAAFDEMRETYAGVVARSGADKEAARTEFINRYTSPAHRDAPGLGCATAALCADVARGSAKGPVRNEFIAGFASMVEWMPTLLSRGKRKLKREEALAAAAMLVGGLMIARATKGQEISEEMLGAIRAALEGN